jgi:hypothetical protein
VTRALKHATHVHGKGSLFRDAETPYYPKNGRSLSHGSGSHTGPIQAFNTIDTLGRQTFGLDTDVAESKLGWNVVGGGVETLPKE